MNIVTQKAEWIKLEDHKPENYGQYLCYGVHGGSQEMRQFFYNYDSGEDFWHDGDMENLNGTIVKYWLKITEPYTNPENNNSNLTYNGLMEIIKNR